MIYRKSSFCSGENSWPPLVGMPNNELLVNVRQINRISARIYCRLPPAPAPLPFASPCARSLVPFPPSPLPPIAKKCIWQCVSSLVWMRINGAVWWRWVWWLRWMASTRTREGERQTKRERERERENDACNDKRKRIVGKGEGEKQAERT